MCDEQVKIPNNSTGSHASKGKEKTLSDTLGDGKAEALLNKLSDKLEDVGPEQEISPHTRRCGAPATILNAGGHDCNRGVRERLSDVKANAVVETLVIIVPEAGSQDTSCHAR